MAFIKRLSNSLWDYVSPRKTTATTLLPTPPTDGAVSMTPTAPAGARKPSRDELKRCTKSMSPSERVQDWRLQSPCSQATSSRAAGKRKRPHTPSSSGRSSRAKRPRIEVEDMDYPPHSPTIADSDGDSAINDFDAGSSSYLRTPYRRSTRIKAPTLDDMAGNMDGVSLVVDEDGYHDSPLSRKIVKLPEELHLRHLGTEDLRKDGWDDDYITLIQRIAMRGYEPLLPSYMKFEYNFLPDELFEQTDDAFICSIRGQNFRASKALEKLFELGGRIRDRALVDGPIEPEEEVRRALASYIKWADREAAFDKTAMLPLLVQEYQEADTPVSVLWENAEVKCRELAGRWKDAFRVAQSIEFSPESSSSSDRTVLSYEMPTLYAIFASYTSVSLMAYRAERDELSPMAYFNYENKDYDMWNSLALALVVCHARDVQCRISEETLIGQPRFGSKAPSLADGDPDA